MHIIVSIRVAYALWSEPATFVIC